MTTVQPPVPRPSYRGLLAVPSFGRLVMGMQVARIAQAMVSVALVLFALTAYRSPALAGIVTFAGIAPGLLVSPIAGALLDRHGRSRLVVLDYLVAAGSMTLMGSLALTGLLPAWLLVAIAAVSSLTAPLSAAGLRSLFPLLVPSTLWERANAVDSNGYVVATVFGPPLAGALVEFAGGAPTLIAIGGVYALAAIVLLRIPDPPNASDSTGRLLVDAWRGLRYTWSHPTLRGLAVALSVLNLAGGMATLVVPLIVLDRLHGGEAAVGVVFAVSGITGMAAAFLFGRLDSRGRERRMLVLPMLGYAAALALLLLAPASFAVVVVVMALSGFLNGPIDIALFTLRQRRTDPAWMGRAFAVSMALNFAGFPIGTAITGWLVAGSLELAIALGLIACLVAAAAAQLMIPVRAAEPGSDFAAAAAGEPAAERPPSA